MRSTMKGLSLMGLAAMTVVTMMGAAFANETESVAATKLQAADTIEATEVQTSYAATGKDGELTITLAGVEGKGTPYQIRKDEATGKLLLSKDGGKTWQEVEGNFEMEKILPGAEGGMYAISITPAEEASR